jgi:hypothetical protein
MNRDLAWDAEPTRPFSFAHGVFGVIGQPLAVVTQWYLPLTEAVAMFAARLPQDGTHWPEAGTWAQVLDAAEHQVLAYFNNGEITAWRGCAAGFAELYKVHQPLDVAIWELEAQGVLRDLA